MEAQRRAALALYDAGPASAALPSLEQIAPKFPRDFAVQEALGLTLAEAGEVLAALPHLEAAQAVRPNDPAALGNLGADLLAVKQYAKAVPLLRRATALQPGDGSTMANFGRALYFNGQTSEAAQVLARASALAPTDSDLLYDLVQALDASKQEAAALRVLEASPSTSRNAAMETLWGDVAEHAGHFEEAERHLQRAADLDPSEPHLYVLVVELLRHWTWAPALEVANFALTRYPESQRLRFAQGVALYGDAKFPQAAGVFAGLLHEAPQNGSYGDLLGRSCAALGGAVAESCSDLIPLARQHPENARLAAFAAISILHRPENEQDLGTAEALLRQSLAHDASDPEAWYQLGVLQQQRQQWSDSENSLRKAVALRPAYAEAHYRLSRALAHLGDKQGAIQELALQQRYVQEEKIASDAQLKSVTIFLTEAKPAATP